MWALEQAKGIARPRILDICTGSGCIAIALKLRLPNAEVVAIDLSDEALAIAQENSSRLSADVRFIKDDALAGLSAIEGEQFDIIISNPPYIPLSERAQMHTNVKDYEPAMALFVEDDDPLIFYREIAHAGQRLLSENGVLMYEIHQTMGDQTTQMLMQQGYRDIELRHDFRQNPRMICCRRSNL